MTDKKAGEKATKARASKLFDDLPEEIFGKGKWIERVRKIKTREMSRIRQAESEQEVYEFLAEYTLDWNLDDFETSKPLPKPHGNPDVFGELDVMAELPWIIETLFGEPESFRKRR